MDNLPRTGIDVPSADRLDYVHAVAAFRSIALAMEQYGAVFLQGTSLGQRPSAGVQGRFWRTTTDATQRIYYDDGFTWFEIGGANYQADGPQNVACLRTLGPGHQQGAAGDHIHSGDSSVQITAILAAIEDLKIMIIMGAYN